MFNWKKEEIAQNAIYLDKEEGGKGRQFKCRFLVPGLVKYDYGVCLLTKENADKFIEGFVGCPVVINHQDVTDANVKEVSVGNIFSVWFDEKDGYFWCNGIITDKKAIELINKGYSVSCQYTITEYSDNTSGALHNGNPYDKIIENGKPEHLAIVNNPRYEGAKIAVNAIMAQNEDKWITIHPNGEENKGRHLLLKDGESVEDAMHRNGWYNKRQAKENEREDKKVIDGLGTVEEVYTHKDGVKQYKINGQWYSEKIIKETQKLNKYKKYTVQDIRKKIQDKKIDELKDIYEKYTSRDKADIFPNLFERAAVGGNVPKDLWLEHNMKELIEQKQPDTKEEKGEENYEKFHKSYYKDNATAWSFKKEKGGTYSVTRYDEKGNYVASKKSKKFDELDRYIDQFDSIKLDIPKRKIKGKDEFQEDKKTIEDFKNKGFEITNQYDDGYNVKYVLKKSKDKDNKTNINNETSKDFVKRILETKIEKYKPTSYTIDWGSLRSQKQGKRSNGMVTGSMGDMTLQGKKEYKSILGGLPEYEDIKNEFNGGGLEGEQMKVAYLKAREAGFNQEDSMDFAYTIFEPENTLYKKLKKQTASNSFVSQFKDTLYTALAEGIANRLGELIASNEDKWITIHPHGEESDDYRRLLIKDGETVEDAMHRQGYYDKRKVNDEKQKKETEIEIKYEQEIKKLKEQHEELVKEFNQSKDYFRKKEIIKENQNIIKQIWNIQGKQTENKRQKLLKNAGDYSKKLNEEVKKNEKIINSIVSVEKDYINANNEWIALGKLKKEAWSKYENLKDIQKASDNELDVQMQKYMNLVGKYNAQRDIVNNKMSEKYKAINQILRIKDGANIEFKTTTKSKKVKDNLQLGKDLLDGIISKNIMPKEPVKAMAIQGGKGRCHYSHQNDRLEMTNEADAPDVAHELMHWLEKKNPKVLDNSLTFLEYRTQGEEVQSLRQLTKQNFDKEEVAKPDKFFSPYCGKIYNHQATEIMSMGIERIFENPKEFAETDIEYMSFVISNLRGEI